MEVSEKGQETFSFPASDDSFITDWKKNNPNSPYVFVSISGTKAKIMGKRLLRNLSPQQEKKLKLYMQDVETEETGKIRELKGLHEKVKELSGELITRKRKDNLSEEKEEALEKQLKKARGRLDKYLRKNPEMKPVCQKILADEAEAARAAKEEGGGIGVVKNMNETAKELAAREFRRPDDSTKRR